MNILWFVLSFWSLDILCHLIHEVSVTELTSMHTIPTNVDEEIIDTPSQRKKKGEKTLDHYFIKA